MDYKRREEIFAKDYLTTRELQELLGFTTISAASQKMTEIKRVTGDTLGIKGKIHTEDYFRYFGIQTTDRYNQLTHDRELDETETQKFNPMAELHREIFKKQGII